jgi:hypothetical protein
MEQGCPRFDRYTDTTALFCATCSERPGPRTKQERTQQHQQSSATAAVTLPATTTTWSISFVLLLHHSQSLGLRRRETTRKESTCRETSFAPFPHAVSSPWRAGQFRRRRRRRGYLWTRPSNHRDDNIRVTTMTSFLASEWVPMPTDATTNYRPGRLPSALVLVIVAFSSSFQCPMTLELSSGDLYLLCQQKER